MKDILQRWLFFEAPGRKWEWIRFAIIHLKAYDG
jgi:hypothetical protein